MDASRSSRTSTAAGEEELPAPFRDGVQGGGREAATSAGLALTLRLGAPWLDAAHYHERAACAVSWGGVRF